VERGEERKEERRRQQTISTGERRGDWRRREETRGETKAEAVTDNARATVNAPLGVGGARHPRHPRATNSCEVDRRVILLEWPRALTCCGLSLDVLSTLSNVAIAAVHAYVRGRIRARPRGALPARARRGLCLLWLLRVRVRAQSFIFAQL
jgi:hypothetical protein